MEGHDAPSQQEMKRESSEAGSIFSKTRYKFWALAAILLLALWSMLTGSVTLKWSSGNITSFSIRNDLSAPDDLDILELEQREEWVRHMWDVYSHSRARLPRFWQEAFEAAYEQLIGEVPSIRDAAISEIAKMSLRSIELDPLSLQSKNTREEKRKMDQAIGRKELNTFRPSL